MECLRNKEQTNVGDGLNYNGIGYNQRVDVSSPPPLSKVVVLYNAHGQGDIDR